jgi:pSer/pThr/pTyr-binding forkhead associated (FHA) protein
VTLRCPSCHETFPLPAGAEGRSTVACPRCARVVVVRDAGDGAGAPAADPSTEPHLEPLAPAEQPTQIGVASQTLSLPRGKRVSVAVLSGPRKGDVFVLERPRLALGREGGGADVAVPDPDVSRSHAALECHGPRIVLRDLDSRNGTFVGGDRVTQREVEDRTEFRLGGTTFMLLVADL